ncbi:MAG: PIG-L deacetylase family protein [Chloroflexota bacterium]
MNILVVSAHSADFCSRAGGTIAKHVRHGDRVKVLSLSYGERSESGGLYAGGAKPTFAEIKAIRHEEATAAAKILGAEIAFLDWGDFCFEYSSERAKVVAQEVRAFRPDVVLTHHGPDPVSVDHDSTYWIVKRGVGMAGAGGLESDYPPKGRTKLFLFEATVPLTELEGFNPDFYVDITATWETKLEALKAFSRAQETLQHWYLDVAKQRAFQAQRLAGRSDIVYAEAFERTAPSVHDLLP